MGTVYMLRNRVNGKLYVGQTKQKLSDRFSVHKGKHSKCRALKAAIAKYGWGAFECIVLDTDVPSDKLLRQRERERIAEYGSYGKGGYNLTPGGEITPMIFPSVVAKRQDTMAKPEMKQKILAIYAQPEVKEAMSQGNKNAWAAYTPEERAARVASNVLVSQTAEAIEKRSAHFRDNPVFMATQKVAQNRPEVAEKRKATWAAKREAKLALLPPEEAAKKRAEAERQATWYAANKEGYNARIRETRVKKRARTASC